MRLESRRCGLGRRPQGPAALIPLPCESHQRRCTEPSPCGQLHGARSARGLASTVLGASRAWLSFSTTSPDMPRRRWPIRTHAGELWCQPGSCRSHFREPPRRPPFSLGPDLGLLCTTCSNRGSREDGPQPGPKPEPTPGAQAALGPPDATTTCLPHTRRVTGLVQKGPPAAGAPRAGSGVRSPPERPQAQSPGAAPCPLPFSAGNNRCPCFRPPRPLQLPGSCSEGPAPTGHGLAEGVLGRRRARESDALEMAAWRSSYFCPDPPSTLVTASQTTRQAWWPRALQPARTWLVPRRRPACPRENPSSNCSDRWPKTQRSVQCVVWGRGAERRLKGGSRGGLWLHASVN